MESDDIPMLGVGKDLNLISNDMALLILIQLQSLDDHSSLIVFLFREENVTEGSFGKELYHLIVIKSILDET